MSRPRSQSKDTTLQKVLSKIEEVDRQQKNLERLLTSGDPSSAVAADAYEGLRRQVVTGASERVAHLTQLVQFKHAIANATSLDELEKHVDGWIEMADLGVVTDLDHPLADSLFEVLGGEGDALEVLEPAYVDGRSSRVVRQGRVRRLEGVRPAPTEEANAAEASVDDATGEETT